MGTEIQGQPSVDAGGERGMLPLGISPRTAGRQRGVIEDALRVERGFGRTTASGEPGMAADGLWHGITPSE